LTEISPIVFGRKRSRSRISRSKGPTRQPPSQRTEVRILFDDRAIYFAFRCFDPDPKTIVANITRRDRDSFSDAIWLDIDTRGDHQSAYHFELSAASVERDGIRTGDVIADGAVNWD
jgi:hypothetical protein